MLIAEFKYPARQLYAFQGRCILCDVNKSVVEVLPMPWSVGKCPETENYFTASLCLDCVQDSIKKFEDEIKKLKEG
jgi:hypothetical protein